MKRTFQILFFVCLATLLLWAANTTLTQVTLKNSTVDSSPVGSITPSSGAFTTLSSSGAFTPSGGTTVSGGLVINGGVQSGTGFKHFRVTGGSCTTSGSQGSTCQTGAISIPGTAYADTNYTGVCMLDGQIATNTATPAIQGFGSKSTASFTLVVMQVGSAAASYGALDCVTMHD